MVFCRNAGIPCPVERLPVPDMTSRPFWVSSSLPVFRSRSRQISCEREAKTEYSLPSPQAMRVMRVSPCDEPNSCGGLN